jgi:hypothetical protein
VLATLTAYVERSLGHTIAQTWRLLGAGLVLAVALLGLALLISGLVAFTDPKTALRK